MKKARNISQIIPLLQKVTQDLRIPEKFLKLAINLTEEPFVHRMLYTYSIEEKAAAILYMACNKKACSVINVHELRKAFGVSIHRFHMCYKQLRRKIDPMLKLPRQFLMPIFEKYQRQLNLDDSVKRYARFILERNDIKRPEGCVARTLTAASVAYVHFFH